jgi:GAF domain-containing protein
MTRETSLARAFVELADTLVAQFDVIDFLHILTDRSVELLGADAAGLMLADQRGDLRVTASTSEAARLMELFELQNSEGPCYDSFHGGRPVVNVDPQVARQRWPNFSDAIEQAGFRSVHALPMRLRGEVIGAVNLFSHGQLRLSDDDVAIGQAMADVATIGLLQERTVRQKEILAEQLQTALNSRVLIEQAKGVLSERTGSDVGEAFGRMRAYARWRGRPLLEVAMAVLDGELAADELAAAPQPGTPTG